VFSGWACVASVGGVFRFFVRFVRVGKGFFWGKMRWSGSWGWGSEK